MSLTRRGAAVAFRLRVLSIPAGKSAAGVATAETTAAAIRATSSALHILQPDWNFQFSRNGSYNPYGHFASRNFSIFPGSANNDDSAGPSDGPPSSSAGGLIPASLPDSYRPEDILDVAAIAETAALESAMEGAWAPTRLLQWALKSVHDGTGLPWWASIMVTTIGIRAATYPITLMQIKNTHRLSQARPEIEKLLEHLKEEQARGNPNATAEYQQRVMAVWQKYNANPMKSMASLVVQAPLFIGFFSALRGLSAAKVPSLVEGGAFWFTDLTVADPTYALPIIASATFLLTIEVGAADGMEGQPDKMKKRMKNIMRVVAIAIVPFTMDLPAAVFCYWTASNAFSLVQALMLKIPGMKGLLGIPDAKALAAAGMGSPGGMPVAGKPIPTFAQKPVAKKNKN